MHFSNMDAYFHLASHGDEQALSLLYKEFVNKAEASIRLLGSNYSKNRIFPEDFCDYIDFLFFKILSEYDNERGSFSRYIEFVLSTRLRTKVMEAIMEDKPVYMNCDDSDDGTINPIEIIKDPNEVPMLSNIVIDNFKATIASPNKNRTNSERTRNKVLMMQIAGYNNSEICRKLNLTPGELRGIIHRMDEDEEMINLKLELK